MARPSWPHIFTFHPRIYQGKLENEHEPKAREQADHKDVVMKGSWAPRESPAHHIGRRDDHPPENAEHDEEESVSSRCENRNGRHHVRACAPGAPVEAVGGLEKGGEFVLN